MGLVVYGRGNKRILNGWFEGNQPWTKSLPTREEAEKELQRRLRSLSFDVTPTPKYRRVSRGRVQGGVNSGAVPGATCSRGPPQHVFHHFVLLQTTSLEGSSKEMWPPQTALAGTE